MYGDVTNIMRGTKKEAEESLLLYVGSKSYVRGQWHSSLGLLLGESSSV